jgi:NADP-dependent 3-hydroxy acid dehydrogenase YdfG
MLKGRWALVTGATAGIGKATAQQLAAQKMNLILIGRRYERLVPFADELRRDHAVEIVNVALDVTQAEQVQQFAEKHAPTLAQVSILINNAGLALGNDPLQQANFGDLEAMIQTNVIGLLRITRLLLPYLMAQPQAHIVNIGSVAGRWVYPGGATYCATKFAVRALSEGLRMDLLGQPVRVTTIEPGMVETEFSEVRFQDVSKAKKVYQGMTPLSAEDIAETIVWCLLRPAHVSIAELVVYPTDQASVGQVHRRQ